MKKPLKVIHILHSSTAETEECVIGFSDKLTPLGIESAVLFIQEKTRESEFSRKTPGKSFAVNRSGGFDLKAFIQLVQLLRREKADIVHTHSLEAWGLGAMAAKWAGCASIHTLHLIPQKPLPAFAGMLNESIVCASEEIRKNLTRGNRLCSRMTEVIYDGIETGKSAAPLKEEERTRLRARFGLKKDSCVIGNIDPLVQENDQATLIKAFHRLVRKEVNAELVIAGQGPVFQELRALIRGLHLDDSVKIFQETQDAPCLLDVLDVFARPAFRPVDSLWVLKAMAAGKPVVTTNIAEHREIVVDEQNGYLVPCGFPERIESALKRLHASPALIAQMGAAGKKRFQERFSFDAQAMNYERLYRAM